MDGIIVIAVILFVFRVLFRGMTAANPSGRKDRSGGAAPRPPYRPPLTPAARPGETAAPDWADIMTMLGGAGTQPQRPPEMEGESTEASGPSGSLTGPSMLEGSPSMLEGSSGSLTGPSMLEGSPSMLEGPGMMEGSPSMLEGPGMMESSSLITEAGQPGCAGAPLPVPETPAAPLSPVPQPRRFDPAAMRGAVVWAEILAKPKALRRVAR